MIDYPETYAKFGAALVRTGKFDAKKLFVPDAMSFAKVPDNIPAEALDGACGVAAGIAAGNRCHQALQQALGRRPAASPTPPSTANTFDARDPVLPGRRRRQIRPSPARSATRSATVTAGRRAAIHDRDTLAEALKRGGSGQAIDYVGVSGAFRFARQWRPVDEPLRYLQYQGRQAASPSSKSIAK